jgi:hypothetical protein
MATWNGPHWKVRPYMTGARVGARRHQLLMHTLVSTGNRFDPLLAASLAPPSRKLYERARDTCSVAELSAFSGLSLGVTRVLLGDLLKLGQLVVHDDRRVAHPPQDVQLLERLRAGLLKLT